MSAAAPGVSAAPAPTSRRFSRDDIVKLGQAGRPWEFLPVVFKALSLAPEDAGLRVLCAANLAQLGLGTAAREHLAALPPQIAQDPSLAALKKLTAGLIADTVQAPAAVETCRRNVARLAERGVDLAGAFAAWEVEARAWAWFRAADGNIVRRKGAAWLGVGDHCGFAERFVRERLAGADLKKADVFTIEGLDPPWLLDRIASATPQQKDGFQPRLIVVQEDPQELLFGLAQADLPCLGEERTSVFVGPGASIRLRSWLEGRAEYRATGPLVVNMAVRRVCEPATPAVLTGAVEAQEREVERLAARVREAYAGRDRAWWRGRLKDAIADCGLGIADSNPKSEIRNPNCLRVLVPTSRFSTFVKHSASDLAAALTRAGCEARLLMEPDDHTRLSSIAWLRMLDEFRPDLVLLINHMRAGVGPWVPPELPFVTWVQDAMPHQFDEATGRAQTDLDFVVGHLHEEMFESFGFARERTLSVPVVASEAKFHDGACDPALLREHECELALVSHHGETPRRMHERLLAEAGAGSPPARAFGAMFPRLRELIERFATEPMKPPLHGAVAAIAQEETERHLEQFGTRAQTLVLRTYALPLADRLLRHQTVSWAADLARERGWRVRLYGRGWGEIPELREFARAEVPHGEPLRACYRAAAAHLHVSIHTLAHQRVMECALSGGLPLSRLVPENLVIPLRVRAQWALATRGEPVTRDPGRGLSGFAWTDQPQGAEYAALIQRLGLPLDPVCWVSDRKRDAWRKNPGLRPPEPDRAAWLLVDMGETTFAGKTRLGELVEAAMSRPDWRSGWSRAIAGRVRERFTYDRFVREVIALVARDFGFGISDRGFESQLLSSNPQSQIRNPQSRRVVSLIAPHGVSGVSSAMARLAALEPPHHPWRMLAIGPGPIDAGGLPGAGTPGFDTLAWPVGTRAVEQIRLVRDRLRSMDATVVSPNFLVQGFVAAALDRHRGRRVAAVFHGSELAAEDLYMRVAPLCDAWRAVSPAIARRVARYAGVSVPPPHLPTGAEMPERCTPLPCARSRHEPLRLLYAGWLDERVKRVMDLAKLADALTRLGVNFQLTVAGRGPAAKELAVAMADHVVAGRVRLAGPVPHAEMDALHRGHDVLVLVSQMEGTPTVVMEAMARGRAVAITRGCGGALEAVTDGVQGVVVVVGDMESLAARLARLNGARDDLATMGARARVSAMGHFDIRALAARFDALVDEAVAAPPGPATPAEAALLWRRMLPAIEYLGETTPAERRSLAEEWVTDLGLAPGSLVISEDPEEPRRPRDGVHVLPLVMPRVVNFASRRMLAALDELGARGCARIVLYGAGKHTQRLGAALEGTRTVAGIVDDRAGSPGGPPERMHGLPVVTPTQAGALGFDAVIVSSDEHERVMLPRAREWAGGKPVLALYAPIETPGGEIPDALIATPPSPRV